MFKGKTILIDGRNSVDSWTKAIKIISAQPEILAGEDYLGNAKYTKDANLIIVLDEEAVEDIVDMVIPEAFEQGLQAIAEYGKEYTYHFVKRNWTLPEKYKFQYNYFDRFINYALPVVFVSQGNLLELNIPEKYFCRNKEGGLTGGFDQISWLHDAIRKDGISRRHQIITWMPGIDCFDSNPPCLQRIWIRVLVPKSEYHKYPGCVPVEIGIMYRSWDIGRAICSNLFGIISMLYRYVLGNQTEETEYFMDRLDINGNPYELNTYNKIDYKIEKMVLFCNSGHVYEDSYDLFKRA